MDSILNSCDPILTMRDAEMPLVSPLLPIKGLRHDEKGDLTDDAISTIMEGVKSLGIQVDSSATRDAMLQEAKTVLCRLNGQYEFLMKMLFTSISRSETVDKNLIDMLRARNQSMQDVLSISRHVLDTPISSNPDGMVEGFIDTRLEPVRQREREAFQDMTNAISHRDNLLKSKEYDKLKDRGLEITEERNAYASRMVGFYGILNVVAVGLLFYVLSS